MYYAHTWPCWPPGINLLRYKFFKWIFLQQWLHCANLSRIPSCATITRAALRAIKHLRAIYTASTMMHLRCLCHLRSAHNTLQTMMHYLYYNALATPRCTIKSHQISARNRRTRSTLLRARKKCILALFLQSSTNNCEGNSRSFAKWLTFVINKIVNGLWFFIGIIYLPKTRSLFDET